MSYRVSSEDPPVLTLNESDTVYSVLQNIYLILKTPLGSVPMYREFGLDMNFLDRPLPAIRPLMLAAIRDAIERFEPRAEVINVEVESVDILKIMWTIEVEISDE